MKKTLLLVLTACLALYATGQPENFKSGLRIFQKTDDLNSAKGLLAVSEKLDSTIDESWDAGTWSVTRKTKLSYQTVGNTTTVISLKRDASTSWVWVNSSRTETVVNTGGDITSQITSSWNSTAPGQWIPAYKMEFTYDGNGNETTSTTYMSISAAPVAIWMGLSKTESFYTSGILTKEEDYSWDNTLLPTPGWAKSVKTEYTYTGADLTKEESYTWDKTLTVPDWVKKEKIEFTYSGGKISQEISYEWDETLAIPDWVKTTKALYTWTGENITQELMYDWDPTLTIPDWVNSSKIVASYDVNGRMTTYSMFIWDETLTIPDWDGFLKMETVYSLITGGSKSVTTHYTGNPLNQGFVESARSTSFFSSVSTSVVNKTYENGIIVYPNPASEYIVFDLADMSGSAKVNLFDIRGNKVLEQTLSENGQISVSHLINGLYIYTVFDNGVFYKGKIVIE
jgi:hypothetical protein